MAAKSVSATLFQLPRTLGEFETAGAAVAGFSLSLARLGKQEKETLASYKCSPRTPISKQRSGSSSSRLPYRTRNLLETDVRDSSPKNRFQLKQLSKEDKPLQPPPPAGRRPPHVFVSPALYATPKSTPAPSSPVSVSPSPYVVVNRRRWEVREPENRLDGFQVREGEAVAQRSSAGCGDDDDPPDDGGGVEEVEESLGRALDDGPDGGEVLEEEKGKDDDCLREFAEACDAASVASGCDTDDGVGLMQRGGWKHAAVSIQSEFFDAPEAELTPPNMSSRRCTIHITLYELGKFLSDSSASSPSMSSNIQADLRAIRLSLFEEIERRKKAEAALECMHKQWQTVASHLSQIGLSFPLPSDAGNLQLELNSVEQICQEVTVARFVSEAVGRGLGKAEAEASAEAIIISKKREISRLHDKLQYYEAMNREMCQRNKEIKEMSRQQRRSRKTRQKWMWRCIGLSIALGTSALAFSYLPQAGKQLLLPAEEPSTYSTQEDLYYEQHAPFSLVHNSFDFTAEQRVDLTEASLLFGMYHEAAAFGFYPKEHL
ncbi:hypothetical protein ACLOJK_015830 [Asimina triloba]